MSRRNQSIIVISLLICLFAAPGFARCKPPVTPTIPDPELASHDEIHQISNDVQTYMEQVETYLTCEKSSSRQTVAQRKMHKVVQQYNDMIEQYKVILAEYKQHQQAQAAATASLNQ